MSDNITGETTISALTKAVASINEAIDRLLEKVKKEEVYASLAEEVDIEMSLHQIGSYLISDIFLRGEFDQRVKSMVDFIDPPEGVGTLYLLKEICHNDWVSVAKIIRACVRISREERKWDFFVPGRTFFLEAIPHVYRNLRDKARNKTYTNEDIDDFTAFMEYLIGFGRLDD